MKIKKLRKLINEEFKLSEIYGSTHLRDRDLADREVKSMQKRTYWGEFENLPDEQFEPASSISKQQLAANFTKLRDALLTVAAAKMRFKPDWQTSMFHSKKLDDLADLTVEISKKLNALARVLQLRVKVENVERESLDEGFLDLFKRDRYAGVKGRMPKRKITDNVAIAATQPVRDCQDAIIDWFGAYSKLSRVQRFMCLGRSGERFAGALKTLELILSDL